MAEDRPAPPEESKGNMSTGFSFARSKARAKMTPAAFQAPKPPVKEPEANPPPKEPAPSSITEAAAEKMQDIAANSAKDPPANLMSDAGDGPEEVDAENDYPFDVGWKCSLL
jgi:hypothetical protein